MMNNTTKKLRILLFIIGAVLILSCKNDSLKAPDEEKIESDLTLSKPSSPQTWDFTATDSYNDPWRLNKYKEENEIIYFRGEYDYSNTTLQVIGQYDPGTKILSLAALHPAWIMCEAVKYLGNDKFYGHYNYNDINVTGTDILRITSNDGNIQFKQNVLSKNSDDVPPQIDNRNKTRR